jgi:hypothetical protein
VRSILEIPRCPGRLVLDVRRYWDGTPCTDPRLHGRVTLGADESGLAIEASLPHQRSRRVPDAPRGARVANLWEYDVVECFLAGAGGRYVEVELGAGGHFLVLSHAAPRVRSDEHEDLALELEHASDGQGWRSRAILEWSLVPPDLSRLNAFVIAGGAHLAYAPVPGAAPDFHQPASFPQAALANGR